MIIGIDLDNTIINYESLFCYAAEKEGWNTQGVKTKVEIKEQLILEDGDDLRWQFLQKEVYSYYLNKAVAYEGVFDFIKKSISLGDEVYIISHKTQFSNLDGKTNLIQPAISWLEKNDFLGEKGLLKSEQVFFCETREEKVKKIALIGCDLFVDDLLPVLLDSQFPKETLKVLFSGTEKSNEAVQVDAWEDLCMIRFLKNLYSAQFIQALLNQCEGIPKKHLECSDGGNHQSFILFMANRHFFVKLSSPQNVKKLENEYKALKLLQKNSFDCVPEALFFSYEHAFLLQSYIDGVKVKTINEAYLNQFVFFIKKLEKLSVDFSFASQCRRNLVDYTLAIDERLESIIDGIDKRKETYPCLVKIQELIENKIIPVKQLIFTRFYQNIDSSGLSEQKVFLASEMILNPSDFGFHNALLSDADSLYFIDFEYFGWDDKAKLICDFIHHLGHNLSLEQKLYFLNSLKREGILTQSLMNRVNLVLDLIGLEWVLIALNIVQEDKITQKELAFSGLNLEQIVQIQYDKAEEMIESFLKNSASKKEIITLGLSEEELWRMGQDE